MAKDDDTSKNTRFDTSEPVEDQLQLYLLYVKDFVDEQLVKERYEWLKGFESDIEYLEQPERFFQDFPDEESQRARLNKQSDLIDSLTLQEDFLAHRIAMGEKGEPKPIAPDRLGEVTDREKSVSSIEWYLKLNPSPHYYRKKSTENYVRWLDKAMEEFTPILREKLFDQSEDWRQKPNIRGDSDSELER